MVLGSESFNMFEAVKYALYPVIVCEQLRSLCVRSRGAREREGLVATGRGVTG